MSIHDLCRKLLPALACALAACGGGGGNDAASTLPPGPPAPAFTNPQRVTIAGYDDDAMEVAVSPDGKYLLFNNSNADGVDTDLRYAERIDDLTFQYRGPIAGANTPSLDGVPSMDRNGNFYFVSTRDYDATLATIYRGTFANGAVSAIEQVAGIAPPTRGLVDFDATISPDGNTLLYTEGLFVLLSVPLSGTMAMANRSGGGFVRAADSDDILREVNAGGVAYAAAISQSGLEIFFNRLDRGTPVIYTATRASTSVPFGAAQKVAGIDGFGEGPALSPDEKSLYYHRPDAGRYVLYRVTRP